MEKYNEIFRLKDMLDEALIDYTFNNLYDGYQIKITYEDEFIISIIEHEFSYNSYDDLIELMYCGEQPISINASCAFKIIRDILKLKKKYNHTGHIYKIPIMTFTNHHFNFDDDGFVDAPDMIKHSTHVKGWFTVKI